LFKHGRFVIFGKSISMSELGGDYFDFFAVDDRHCALLAGDVAGHGVAAALIMAMAKAGIISSSHLLQSPSELLQALHSMIIASRGNQQKKVVMTFQYLYVDSHSGTGRYANAGACSPMLLQQNGRIISELTQTSSPLGVFNHSRFDEMEYQPADGDAIVFYTDGIIEARSPENQVIGYEGFKEILQKAYHPDPQLFYQQIYAAYIEHIGSSEPQDDLTIIISVCQPS
jgi:sigma-B regulation protein RsbU (phosphoserine phosphatase)